MGKFTTIVFSLAATVASAETLQTQGYGPRIKSIPLAGTHQIYTAYLSSEKPIGDERILLDSNQTVQIELRMLTGKVLFKQLGGSDIIDGLEEGYMKNCKSYWHEVKGAKPNKDGSTYNVCGAFQPFLEKLKGVSNKVGELKTGDRFLFRFTKDKLTITFQGEDGKTQELTSIDNQPGLPFSRFMPLNWIGVPLDGNKMLKEQMLNAKKWGTGKEKAEAFVDEKAVIAIDPANSSGHDIN